MNKPTLKDLAKVLSQSDKIDLKLYDTIVEMDNESNRDKYEEIRKAGEKIPTITREDIVSNWIEDVLDYLGVEIDNLKQYTENSVLEDLQERSNEYADNNVEIYTGKLWRNAPILSEYIEDAMSEFGTAEDVIKTGGITKLFEQGEYYFYDMFCRQVIDALEEYAGNL